MSDFFHSYILVNYYNMPSNEYLIDRKKLTHLIYEFSFRLFSAAELTARFLIPSLRGFSFYFGTKEEKLIFYHRATRYRIIRGL